MCDKESLSPIFLPSFPTSNITSISCWILEEKFGILNINNISDINNIDFSLSKNGIKVQHSNTNLMIFNIKYLIHFISQKITIEKGDIIFTGTPKGVGKISNQDILEGYINDEKILNININ